MGRRARDARRAHPQGHRRRPQDRGHVPRRSPRPRRLRRARAAGLGRRRPQLAHQRLQRRGAARLHVVVGLRPALARLREREVHAADLGAPRDRPLLQPARAAHHRRQDEGRQTRRLRHPPVEHREHGRLLAGAAAGHRGDDAARLRARDPARWPRRLGLRAHVGRVARLPARARSRAGLRRLPARSREGLRLRDARARRRGLRPRRRRRRRGRPRDRPRRQRLLVARLAQRRRRQRRRLGRRAQPAVRLRARRRRRVRRRHRGLGHQQVRAGRVQQAAPAGRLERTALPARVATPPPTTSSATSCRTS
jgi:hypothetical protein